MKLSIKQSTNNIDELFNLEWLANNFKLYTELRGYSENTI
jgi:hypothetical protein